MIHKVCRADSTLAQRFRYRCRIHRTFPGTTYLPYPTFQPASPHHTPPAPITPSTAQPSLHLPPCKTKPPVHRANLLLPCQYAAPRRSFFATHTEKKDPRPSVKTNSLTHSLVVKKKKQTKKKKRLLLSKGGGDAWMQKGGKGGGILRLSSYIYTSHQVNG